MRGRISAGAITMVAAGALLPGLPALAQDERELPRPVIIAPPVSPPAPVFPPRGLARDPQPRENPGLWVTPEDYPRDALLSQQEGTVRFRLEVDETGTASGCLVTMTSGTPSLDEAACRLLRERAVFRPALDRDGKPTAGHYSSAVRWVIPEPNFILPPASGAVIFSFVVERDGKISSCEIEQAEGVAAQELARFSPCPKVGTQFEPYRDESGNPVRKRVITTFQTDVIDLLEGAAPQD